MQATARNDLIRLTRSLLVGPLDEKEIIQSAPGDTYLTGILWPEGALLGADEDDNSDGAATTDDGETDAGVPGYRAIRPCSIGLTVAVDLDAAISVSLGSTSRYEKREIKDEQGNRQDVHWARRPLGYSSLIPAGKPGTWRIREFMQPGGDLIEDGALELHVRRRIRQGKQIVTVTLVNKASQSEEQMRDECCLFQTEIRLSVVKADGAGSFLPRPPLQTTGGDEDAQSAALIYRDVLEFAAGHGIATMWDDSAGSACVETVWTSWLPEVSVRSMSATGAAGRLTRFFTDHPSGLKASWLSDFANRKAICTALDAFVGVYDEWIVDTLESRVGSFAGDQGEAARRNLANCREASRRIREGVECLRNDDGAWRAFVLANAAMDRQAQFEVKGDRKGPLAWRPFQLAYFLLAIPGLADPENAGRDCVDLLWFPTGGGKTEAYLALAAFQIFFRRIRDEQRRENGGVDVLMRYTLRLLTVQQFQRAASLVCACDQIRREAGDLGAAPISLGLYVGGEATPNRTGDAFAALSDEHAGRGPRSTPRQLLDCPVCGTALPASSWQARTDESGIDIRCAAPSCLSGGELLPVLTVDDFIYAEPPSLLIGTIDKFAQLPRRQDIRAIFGLDAASPPGLIIQDELHLISGPLGSMSGLYETAIDLLCTSGGVRPKIIGSTATIGQAAKQVRALFDRDVLQFPPSGFDASDSFFAVREGADAPDRVYLGLSSTGRSPKFALQAASAALLQAAEQLRHGGTPLADLDPYWTAVIYFNSLRELGGAHVLLQDDIPRQMAFLAGRLSSSQRMMERPAIELSSRVPSRELPDYLSQLEASLPHSAADPLNNPEPRDSVLASNMISVGVDVSRLGLMIVNGQPKTTAEYIQASSRVGRGIPGLVLTLYNASRPRDISHFEHFSVYHGALYRGVEATSVTPWAARARDKALHAVLAAAVRHLVEGMSGEGAAIAFDSSEARIREIIEFIVARADASTGGVESADTRDSLNQLVADWARKSSASRAGGKPLLYWEKKAPFGRTKPHLMTSAEEGARPGLSAWVTPNSMREVEPSTAFVLRQVGRRTNGETGA